MRPPTRINHDQDSTASSLLKRAYVLSSAPDAARRGRSVSAGLSSPDHMTTLPLVSEQLLTQLLGFGVEKHDDGVDALVYLILGLVGEGIALQEIHYV